MIHDEGVETMRLFGTLLAAAALLWGSVPAFAQEAVANPSTGDNSMVTLALVIMGIAAVVIVAVLFFTRKK